MKRRIQLAVQDTHHVFSRSIAGYHIFNNDDEYSRLRDLALFYQSRQLPCSFSHFLRYRTGREKGFRERFEIALHPSDKQVQVIAYCFMPTHVHFLLKQVAEKGIAVFMGNLLNSYSRYFNLKHGRRGPLWEGRFKNVHVETNEQLLHLTRYIHLNPVTSSLCEKPEDWKFSSYQEYISEQPDELSIADWSGLLEIKPEQYRQFVEERINYQKELHDIKSLLID